MSIYSNIDINLSDSDRDRAENEENTSFLLDDKIKKSQGYKNHGFLNPRHATVTKDQDNWDAGDVRARRASGKPVLPAFIMEQDDGEVGFILTEADREAVMQGYVCENCLSWQESILDLKCNSPQGFSCGHTRGM